MSTLLVSVNFNGNIGAVQSYSTITGRFLSQQRLSGIPTGLAVGRNGLFVGNASDRFSIITRIAQNQVRTFADPPVGTTDLAIGFNGNLFSLSRQGFIQEFDGRTGAFIRPLAIGTTFTTGITFGPDGAIYASTVRGNIERVDPRTGRILATVGFLLPGPRDLAFNRSGQLFVLTARNGNSVEIIGGPRGPIPFVRGLRTPTSLAFSPQGNLFVADAGFGGVLEFNGTTGAFLRLYQTRSTPQYIAFSAAQTRRVNGREQTRITNQPDPLTGLRTEQGLIGITRSDELVNHFARKNGNKNNREPVVKQVSGKALYQDDSDRKLAMGFGDSDLRTEFSQKQRGLQPQRQEVTPFDSNSSGFSPVAAVISPSHNNLSA